MRDEYGYVICDHCSEPADDIWAVGTDCYNTDYCIECLVQYIQDLPRGANATIATVRYHKYADGTADRQVYIDGGWTTHNGGWRSL